MPLRSWNRNKKAGILTPGPATGWVRDRVKMRLYRGPSSRARSQGWRAQTRNPNVRISPGTSLSACLWVGGFRNGRGRGHPDPVKVKLRLASPRGLGSHTAARFISDLAAGLLRWSARWGSEAGPSWAWMLLPAPISSQETGPQSIPSLTHLRAAGLRARPRRSPAELLS